MARVQLKDVSFRYPGADADTLSDLSLEIGNGEAHALLGASGAGKTTLLNLLSGLLAPSSGEILFDDEPVGHLPGKARNVAQVFQFPVLYEQLTVADNLGFALRTRHADAAVIRERVAFLAEELKLSGVMHLKPGQLDLFHKQLTQVGKALVRPDVSLVLLDEPLTAVEPRIKWDLRRILKQAQADLGVTMIYVTHDQTEALTFADRVTLLTAEGIMQTGTPQQLYEQPAHRFVGHFVGSPGMNFLPASVCGVPGEPDAGETLVGFRPEWATVEVADAPQAMKITGTVLRTRPQAAQGGRPTGLVTLAVADHEIHVLGWTDVAAGTRCEVAVERHERYADQVRVAS